MGDWEEPNFMLFHESEFMHTLGEKLLRPKLLGTKTPFIALFIDV